jgi:hypothetical protein
MLLGAGKEGKIYLMNRDQFTTNNIHYNATTNPPIMWHNLSAAKSVPPSTRPPISTGGFITRATTTS